MSSPPSLDQPIVNQTVCLKSALIVPPPKGDANRSVQKSGVLDVNGAFVENSITWRNTNQINLEPPMPVKEDIATLEAVSYTHLTLPTTAYV